MSHPSAGNKNAKHPTTLKIQQPLLCGNTGRQTSRTNNMVLSFRILHYLSVLVFLANMLVLKLQ